MLTCKQTTLLVSLSYDRRLSWRERLGVRLHLMFCEACTHFARQMRFLHKAARRFAHGYTKTNEPVGLSAEAIARIMRELNRHQ